MQISRTISLCNYIISPFRACSSLLHKADLHTFILLYTFNRRHLCVFTQKKPARPRNSITTVLETEAYATFMKGHKPVCTRPGKGNLQLRCFFKPLKIYYGFHLVLNAPKTYLKFRYKIGL